MNRKDKESGSAVMLEGVMGISAALVVLVFLMSFGFYLYQISTVQIVANEIAEEISHTYKFLNADTADDIGIDDYAGIGRYRYIMHRDKFKSSNETKAVRLIEERLPQTSLQISKDNAKVSIDICKGDICRMYYVVKVEKKYSFMLGKALSLIGRKDAETISAISIVENVDVINYIHTMKLMEYTLSKGKENIKLIETFDHLISNMKKIAGVLE